jgi:hypothetical protein
MAVSLAVLVGILLAADAAHADWAVRQVELSSLAGQVEWLQAGSETWQPAAVNQSLASGDKIRTGQDGQATLALDEGSTIQLTPGSEFAIQTLSEEPESEHLQSTFGLWQGKLIATITPVAEGSVFQFETTAVTISVPAGGADPTLVITINPDGSVSVRSDDGPVDLIREGDYKMHARLESGEEALVEFDPATGVLRVTSLTGTFEVIGPDEVPITLASGDSVVYSGGAATFIPGAPPVEAPAVEAIGEPVT